MKKLLSMSFFFLLVLVGCGSADEEVDNVGETTSSKSTEISFDSYVTTDELYELAKEEGEVVLYSATSAGERVGSAFEEAYPGVKALVTKVSDPEIYEKVKREHESGLNNADIILGKGTNGSWSNDLLENGYIAEYKPEEIMKHIDEPYKSYKGLPLISEVITIVYNTEHYEEPPIDNWWDLTTDEWTSKILLKDPLSAPDIQGLFMTMVKHSDDMEKAYEEKFEEPLELNDTENAGYEFIKRLLDNDAVLMSSMGDTVDAVAESRADHSVVAIASTVKLRDVVQKDAAIGVNTELQPKISVPGTSKIFVTSNVENIAATKLFIRFMTGGEDGTAEGFDPFNNPGTFAVRNDIEQDNIIPSLAELNLWEEDEQYFYEHQDEMRNFLLKIQ
ncbi:extracellular solute-binding protein [Alkalihalobacillus sp. 1P02AB]|uniref:ABC transporter substrate-binding protein n=1 Tax=Alkalihalobacillus sp. 1P02AB TaxID=3132260 RepID=UPI0039A56954